MKRKKLLKALGGLLLLVMISLIVVPLYLEARIEPILREKVNASIKGNFDFKKVQLSLLRNFPSASITLEDLLISTEAPFEGDTLLQASRLHLVLGMGELLTGAEEPIRIQRLDIEGADLRLVSDSLERTNYDILIEDAPEPSDISRASAGSADLSTELDFALEAYHIDASRISYEDKAAGYTIELEDLRHTGFGDLSLEEAELHTQTEARVSLTMDKVAYLNRYELQWDAVFGIDLGTNTYTFDQNRGRINRMPLEMEGWVRLLDAGQEFDLQFSTPDSAFKNLLGLIPEAYSGSLEEVSASGQLALQGKVEGIWNEERTPAYRIGISVADGSFKYGEMPLGVKDIQLGLKLENPSGMAEDTNLEVSRSVFSLADEQFALEGMVRNLIENPEVRASLKGILNLKSLSMALPALHDSNLSGKIRVDVHTAFDKASVVEGRYEDTETSGSLNVQGLQYQSGAFTGPLKIEEASVGFEPREIRIASIKGTLGQSDFNAQGTLNSYLGYLLYADVLKGQMVLQSNRLDLSDVQPSGSVSETIDSGEQMENLELPADMSLSASFQVGMLIYDGMEMRDVSGALWLEDQQLRIENMKSRTMEGSLAMEGTIAADGDTPGFDLELGMQEMNIATTMNTMELMQTMVPVASMLEGRFNTRFQIRGVLNKDMSPDLTSLTGQVVAEVLTGRFSGEQPPVFDALAQQLDFFDPGEWDMRGLKTVLAFENGRVAVSPFSFQFRDMEVSVAGGHTFDHQLDYTATFEVPAGYLGTEVNRMLAALKDPALDSLTVPVTASIGGRYKNPQIQTDLKAVAGQLATRLVEMQKQRLVSEGKDKAQDLLNELLTRDQDTAIADSTGRKGGLEGLLKGVKRASETAKPQDSVPQPESGLKRTAKSILGGLLGKKGDTTTVEKDSTKQ